MKYTLPLWLKNIENALQFDNVFIIHGQEIKDDVVLPSNSAEDSDDVSFSDLRFRSFHESIKYILARNGFNALICYDINNQFTVEALDDTVKVDDVKLGIEKKLKVKFENPEALFFEYVPELINGLNNDDVDENIKYALMIDYFSETDPKNRLSDTHPNIEQSMLASYQLAKSNHLLFEHSCKGSEILVKHPVFWVAKDISILPNFLLSGIGIRQVPIPAPNLEDRNLAIAAASWKKIPFFSQSPDVQEQWFPLFKRVAEGTSGLSVAAIRQIAESELKDYGENSTPEIAINKIINSAKEYRVGLTKNPWGTEVVKKRIEEGIETLSKRVIGQDYAIRKSVDVLKMARLDLNSIDSKHVGTAPRGCLFFIGPTGVGKTELAKSIAELVFGSEDDMIRFDMSEFQETHHADRLIGSPPGYVGNEQGGELTNKVKAKPFSLVLFDEIDKAHVSIFDKFLQILSDGRLTDGRGDTVFFSETIIVFTSNKGVVQMQDWLKQNQGNLEGYRNGFKRYMEDYFRTELGKPEVFGRIDEDNIIAFNPIDTKMATSIAQLGIRNIVENVEEQLHVSLELSEKALTTIIDHATREDVLKYGGRGVKNALRKLLVKPLTKPLLDLEKVNEKKLSIVDVVYSDGIYELMV